MGDITYLATAQGWAYLAAVLDLFSRKIVDWTIADLLETELVNMVLRRAIEASRPVGHQLLHHSDRGCQYTSEDYHQTFKTLDIACSRSRTGCCYDDAVIERSFWSLKHAWTNHEDDVDLGVASLSVFQYIEVLQCNAVASGVRLPRARPIRSRSRPGHSGVNNRPPLPESTGLTHTIQKRFPILGILLCWAVFSTR